MTDFKYQRDLLANTLGAVLTKLGVVPPDVGFTGPQIVQAAAEYLQHHGVQVPPFPERFVELPEPGGLFVVNAEGRKL